MDVEFGLDLALAVFAAGFRNMQNPVDHQHGGQRQLGIARTEHAAVAAFQDVFQRVV